VCSRGGLRVECALLLLLTLDEPLDTIERDARVVADDAAAAVGVRQAGEDVGAAAGPHVGGVGVEYRVVVGLAVLGEDLHDLRIRLVVVGLESIYHQTETAVRQDAALERCVGLQSDDDLVVPVDSTRAVAAMRQYSFEVGAG
jgi:hypothetical protein